MPESFRPKIEDGVSGNESKERKESVESASGEDDRNARVERVRQKFLEYDDRMNDAKEEFSEGKDELSDFARFIKEAVRLIELAFIRLIERLRGKDRKEVVMDQDAAQEYRGRIDTFIDGNDMQESVSIEREDQEREMPSQDDASESDQDVSSSTGNEESNDSFSPTIESGDPIERTRGEESVDESDVQNADAADDRDGSPVNMKDSMPQNPSDQVIEGESDDANADGAKGSAPENDKEPETLGEEMEAPDAFGAFRQQWSVLRRETKGVEEAYDQARDTGDKAGAKIKAGDVVTALDAEIRLWRDNVNVIREASAEQRDSLPDNQLLKLIAKRDRFKLKAGLSSKAEQVERDDIEIAYVEFRERWTPLRNTTETFELAHDQARDAKDKPRMLAGANDVVGALSAEIRLFESNANVLANLPEGIEPGLPENQLANLIAKRDRFQTKVDSLTEDIGPIDATLDQKDEGLAVLESLSGGAKAELVEQTQDGGAVYEVTGLSNTIRFSYRPGFGWTWAFPKYGGAFTRTPRGRPEHLGEDTKSGIDAMNDLAISVGVFSAVDARLTIAGGNLTSDLLKENPSDMNAHLKLLEEKRSTFKEGDPEYVRLTEAIDMQNYILDVVSDVSSNNLRYGYNKTVGNARAMPNGKVYFKPNETFKNPDSPITFKSQLSAVFGQDKVLSFDEFVQISSGPSDEPPLRVPPRKGRKLNPKESLFGKQYALADGFSGKILATEAILDRGNNTYNGISSQERAQIVRLRQNLIRANDAFEKVPVRLRGEESANLQVELDRIGRVSTDIRNGIAVDLRRENERLERFIEFCDKAEEFQEYLDETAYEASFYAAQSLGAGPAGSLTYSLTSNIVYLSTGAKDLETIGVNFAADVITSLLQRPGQRGLVREILSIRTSDDGLDFVTEQIRGLGKKPSSKAIANVVAETIDYFRGKPTILDDIEAAADRVEQGITLEDAVSGARDYALKKAEEKLTEKAEELAERGIKRALGVKGGSSSSGRRKKDDRVPTPAPVVMSEQEPKKKPAKKSRKELLGDRLDREATRAINEGRRSDSEGVRRDADEYDRLAREEAMQEKEKLRLRKKAA